MQSLILVTAMIHTFTRLDAIKLSGLTRHQLELLIKYDIVKPAKAGDSRGSKSFYSWEQIIELRIIYRLREDASMQKIREALESLKGLDFKDCLSGEKAIIAFDNHVYLVDEKEMFALLLSGKQKYQLVMTFSIRNIVEDVEEQAIKNNIVAFSLKRDGKYMGVQSVTA
jgi:DNA-binding transcriptional MerR regulator